MGKKSLIITGANGFIGSNLIHDAISNNWVVNGIVRRQSSAEYITKLGAKPIIIPELDEDAYIKAFEGAKAVVHLIGIVEGDDRSFHEAHVESTRIVLEAADASGLDRMINMSGLGVDQYGKVHWANNRYFGSKYEAELLLSKYNTPYVNFRPSYIFGPESYWFASLFRGIQKGIIHTIGNGLIPIQPIYVKDVTNSFLAAADGRGPHNTHYDMVGPEITNMNDMVQRVIRYYNEIHKKKHYVTIEHIPYELATQQLTISQEKAAVSQCDILGDNKVLQRELGIRLTLLNAAIKTTISNFSLL